MAAQQKQHQEQQKHQEQMQTLQDQNQKLADTRANTRLMHWYVLSENINNVTESLA